MNSKSLGFSLIEILLVVGLIAVLALAAFVAFPKVQAGRQAQTERANASHITASLKQVHILSGYTSLTNDTANYARAFPTNMNNGSYAAGQAIQSSWGSPVRVGPAPNPNHLQVVYEEVPPKVCLPLLQSFTNMFEYVEVNTVAIKDNISGTTVDVETENMISACAGDEPVEVLVRTF